VVVPSLFAAAGRKADGGKYSILNDQQIKLK
jgi:hypothetical protein